MNARWYLMLLCIAATGCDPGAGPERRTLTPREGSYGEIRNYVSFGDSIVAGYCGWYCQEDSYAVHMGQGLADRDKLRIEYFGRGESGALMEEIADEVAANHELLATADLITLEGCGNDYLEARDTYKGQADCTDGKPIAKALETCKTNMTRALDEIKAVAKPSANVVVMTLYYPTVAEDKGNSCGTASHFDLFLPFLLQSNWWTCNEAWKRGYQCVDAMSVMNAADIDADANQIVDSEQIRMKAALDEDNMPTYQARIANNRSVLADGHAKIDADAVPDDYLQSDSKHPSQQGHQGLAAAHLALIPRTPLLTQ